MNEWSKHPMQESRYLTKPLEKHRFTVDPLDDYRCLKCHRPRALHEQSDTVAPFMMAPQPRPADRATAPQ